MSRLSAATVVCLALALPAHGQNYPQKPIRIVTSLPGGSLDLTARVIGPPLSARIGQPVIVDNRGGVLSMEIVAKSPADGHTLLLASASLWLSTFLRDKVAWDALRDYAPVSLLVTSPNIIVVHPALPVNTLKELIALAKARPGELNYSTGQAGASAHLAGELFKSLAGVNLLRVAYKGQGAAMLSLITGEAQLSFPNAASVTPFIKAGKVKALAVTSTQPSALAPGLPTAASSGVPGYESRAILGLFAPARTPAAIIEQLHQETARILGSAEVKQRLFDSGSEALGGSPADMIAAMKLEMASIGKLIQAKGIRAE